MTTPEQRLEAAPGSVETAPWKEAYIGLGSNMGNRDRYLQEAVRELNNHPHVALVRVSDVYETEPVGYTNQESFLNMVVVVRTTLPPDLLHKHMKAVEDQLGRVRTIRNGPRTVDLDLLLMDDIALDTPDLVIPHPRMWDRAFVLVPLRDAALGKPNLLASIAEHLDRLDGKEGVTHWSTFNWPSASERFGN